MLHPAPFWGPFVLPPKRTWATNSTAEFIGIMLSFGTMLASGITLSSGIMLSPGIMPSSGIMLASRIMLASGIMLSFRILLASVYGVRESKERSPNS